MAPKKKQKSSSIHGHSTSSPPKEIEDKFVTLQCATNFHAAMKTRTTFILERGFKRPPSELAQVIQSRGWDTFVKPHQPAMATIVREFYENLPEHKDRRVFVRGKWVSFRRDAIKTFYGLQDVDNSAFDVLQRSPDYDSIISFLTDGKGTWKTNASTQVAKFPNSMLAWMEKLWHIFIAHNFHSSCNISEVTKAKAIFLYAIVKNIYFDVGKMIEEDILSNMSARCTKTFGHPALITALCLQHKVMVGSNEERIQPMLPLSETTLRGKIQTTTPEGAYDSGHAKSSDEETPVEPSFPRICDTGGPSSAPTSDVHAQLHNILQEQRKKAEILDPLLLTQSSISAGQALLSHRQDIICQNIEGLNASIRELLSHQVRSPPDVSTRVPQPQIPPPW